MGPRAIWRASRHLARRAVARAEFAHFTADAAVYGQRIDALGSLGPSQLEDFYARYLNRQRARTVLVRPIPSEKGASMGRVGIGDLRDDTSSTKYDVASVRKLAVSPRLAEAFHVKTLANGLFVQAARFGTTPIVTIGLGLRAARAEESEDGAAKMAWYLATPGNPLHGRFRDYGAIFDRTVSTDSVTFRVRATSNHVDKIMAILADYVTSLKVHAEEFNHFDRFELSYMRREQQRPEYIGNRDFRKALFGPHAFGHTSEIPDKSRPDRAATNKWLEVNFVPSRAVLAIAGDVDPEEVIRTAESAFGSWSGPPGNPDPEPLGQTGARAEVVAHRPGATQAVIELGCRMPSMGWMDEVHARAVAVALSARIGSVRQSRGASYGLHAWVETLRGGTGVLHVGGAVENAGVSSALRTIQNEIMRLAALKGSELDRGRWAIATGYNLGLTTTSEYKEAWLPQESEPRQGGATMNETAAQSPLHIA
jgi:zinc protease